ncbi:MAG: polysaccharide deacetylase family protein [Chitinophagaceae bacterium]|nr:polysaccharide deacetylase family protein [Chitinophagaceae bacterium]MCW5905139.1 polysaccharide deacetylase family protein [Chitinophagaceae bacterium]
MYLAKTYWWLKALYPSFIWNMSRSEKVLYLTFDDGPHHQATPFILEQLALYNAKATFFCIGKNVVQQPDIFQHIIQQGHTVGNHTQHHINGWNTKTHKYIEDVKIASNVIDSNLFRPPYGRVKRQQAKQLSVIPLTKNKVSTKIIMWDVLSGDFDTSISPESCLQNVLKYAQNGSIIVFHDSDKAWKRMYFALPKVLEYYTNKGYIFKAIP